jgi:hypothetical protein
MDANKIILDAVHDARALLIHHVQTRQGREPERTIEDLRSVLESTAVSQAVNKLRGDRGAGRG